MSDAQVGNVVAIANLQTKSSCSFTSSLCNPSFSTSDEACE